MASYIRRSANGKTAFYDTTGSDHIRASFGNGRTITQWELSISGRLLAWVGLARPLRSHKNPSSQEDRALAKAEVLLTEPVSGCDVMKLLFLIIFWSLLVVESLHCSNCYPLTYNM
jgi:hypothetical protein